MKIARPIPIAKLRPNSCHLKHARCVERWAGERSSIPALSGDREVECKSPLRVVVSVEAVVDRDIRLATLRGGEFTNKNFLEGLGS